MRFIVTGIAGFIGSHLGDVLLDAGHRVVGVDCLTPHYDRALKDENASRFDMIRADLAVDPLGEILDGADGLFHLAAQPGMRSFDAFEDYVHHNVLASQRVFEACAAVGIRVVLASSSSVYGDTTSYPTPESQPSSPVSPYGITKLASEQLARAYARSFDLDVVVLRYFTVYGPRQRPDMLFARIAAALATGTTIAVYGDGSQSRSFTFVSDAVDATVAAMERARPDVYNVGGATEATVLEAIAMFEEAAGRPLDVEYLPGAAGDLERTAADTSKIRRELGWEPRVPLATGIRAQWAWTLGRSSAGRAPSPAKPS